MLAGTPLAQDETILNGLSLPGIEAPIVIADEVFWEKNHEMYRSHDLALQRVTADYQEILDGFGFVQSKLADLTIIWQLKDQEEAIKIKNLHDQFAELLVLLTAQKAGEDLHLTAIQNDMTVEAYDKTQSLTELQKEASLKAQVVAAKEALQYAHAYAREQMSTLRMQMEELLNNAKQTVIRGPKTKAISDFATEELYQRKIGGGE
jgi:hypothetical protein